jgi:hypothetical protein
MFFLLFFFPVMRANSQAIWRSKVPPGLQGRTFSVRLVLTEMMRPITYLAAGPLVDHTLNPLLVENGPLADSLGRIMGVGPGRGNGIILSCLGLIFFVASVAGWLYPRLRNVETELPDRIDDDQPGEVADSSQSGTPLSGGAPESRAETPPQSGGDPVAAPLMGNVSEESGTI